MRNWTRSTCIPGLVNNAIKMIGFMGYRTKGVCYSIFICNHEVIFVLRTVVLNVWSWKFVTE